MTSLTQETLTINDMDSKRKLKLRDIRDTLYFKPCNFNLNTLEDFALTYCKQENKCGCNYQLFKHSQL